MTTEQILFLDLRKEENFEIIQKVLKKIKPFSKCEEKVDIDLLDKYIDKVCRKYYVCSQYMMISRLDDKNIYTISFRDETSGSWIDSVYGITVYEVFAKSAIFLFSKVKRGEIKLRGGK